MMEIEILLQFFLVFSLGLLIGLPFSSRLGNKHLKENVKYLEGKINRYKQDKPKNDDLGLLGLLDGGDLSAKNIIKILKNLTPEQIKIGKNYLDSFNTKNDQNNLGDSTTWR
jgi:hypothetical protein